MPRLVAVERDYSAIAANMMAIGRSAAPRQTVGWRRPAGFAISRVTD